MSINEFIVNNEIAIRLVFFFGTFILMAAWELVAPKRALTVSKLVRWVNNLGLVTLNSFFIRIVFPAAAVGISVTAYDNQWGLFNLVEVPIWLAVIASVVIMDFVIYLQHVIVHAVPMFWRFHRVHHADLDYDVTTGSRFHPFEIFLSMGIKFVTIVLLGPPIIAVIIFEVMLSTMAMFNHGNVGLPEKLDKILRFFVVTPDMHRVHHSIEDDEANSNFGFNLTWWDHLFGTYRDQPHAGHEGMTIGIHQYRDMKQVSWLPGMLWLPFIGKMTSYVINKRNRDQYGSSS